MQFFQQIDPRQLVQDLGFRRHGGSLRDVRRLPVLYLRVLAAVDGQLVLGYRAQPGTDFAGTVKTFRVQDCLVKCLLRQLFRDIRVVRQGPEVAEDGQRVPLVDFFHGLSFVLAHYVPLS